MIHLPIDDFLPQIKNHLNQSQNLVLTAEPGAGKTTRLPAALLDCTDKKILVLEPRRMAAVAAASRVSEEFEFVLGQEVGYQVRFDNRTSDKSRLIFMTEALLVKKMGHDPELQDVGIIVLDEFHERSLHVDLALGLIKELQELGSPIKLVVMSATLDAENISNYLNNCPIIAVPGKLFPLEIIYNKNSQLLRTLPQFYDNVVNTIKQALLGTKNDLLVFLPGVGEIERLAQIISDQNLAPEVLKLHGSLALNDQKNVLKKHTAQRIILSTNIAESSVTVDGVDTVIDTGLEKNVRYDNKSGFSKLELSRISISSATQRAGRAARQYPGRCFKMWNKQDEYSFPKDTISEIQRSDLSEGLLFLASQGISNFSDFPWFEKPSALALQSGTLFLESAGLIDENQRISDLGRKALELPTPLRSSLIVLAGVENGTPELGCLLASLLQERDIFPKNHQLHLSESDPESDLLPRLEIALNALLNEKTPAQANRNTLNSIIQGYHQLLNLLRIKKSELQNIDKKDLDFILKKTFKDRLCRRRGKSERALMMGGRGVKLTSESLVKKSEFFFAIQGMSTSEADSSISLASEISKDFLLKEFATEISRKSELTYSEDKKQYYVQEYRALESLPLDEPILKPAAPSDIADKIVGLCILNFEMILKENPTLQKWLERFRYFQKDKGTIDIQALTEKALEQAAYGATSLKEVYEKNLTYFWEQELEPETLKVFQTEFPDKVKVPSGSLIPIHYSLDKDPYIEVRIQEVFGWTKTPAVNFGKTNLIIHLLGPNFRPVQVTSNIESFWKNAYGEVRKELRIKYPKHQWPENPADGIAEAKGRPKK